MVLLVLGVEGAEVGECLLKDAAVPHEFGGNKALDELDLPVSDFVAELVRRVGGPSAGFAYMVAGDGEVLKGIEQRAVKVEYHVGVGHGQPLRKSPATYVTGPVYHGWGRGIRTPVTGTKNQGPAAGRCPKWVWARKRAALV